MLKTKKMEMSLALTNNYFQSESGPGWSQVSAKARLLPKGECYWLSAATTETKLCTMSFLYQSGLYQRTENLSETSAERKWSNVFFTSLNGSHFEKGYRNILAP